MFVFVSNTLGMAGKTNIVGKKHNAIIKSVYQTCGTHSYHISKRGGNIRV